MRQERIRVILLHYRRGTCEGRLHVAALQNAFGRLLLRHLVGLLLEVGAVDAGVLAGIPLGFERFGRFAGLVPGVGDDGDTIDDAHGHAVIRSYQRVGCLHLEYLHDARHLLDGVEIALHELAAVHGAALVHRVLHPRHHSVDAENGLALNDQVAIDAADRLADDLEVFRVLERHGLQIRRCNSGGLLGQLTVAEGLAALVSDYTIRGCAISR